MDSLTDTTTDNPSQSFNVVSVLTIKISNRETKKYLHKYRRRTEFREQVKDPQGWDLVSVVSRCILKKRLFWKRWLWWPLTVVPFLQTHKDNRVDQVENAKNFLLMPVGSIITEVSGKENSNWQCSQRLDTIMCSLKWRMSSSRENSLIKYHLAENQWKQNLHLPCLSKTKEFQAWLARTELKIKTNEVKVVLSVSKSRKLVKTIYAAAKIWLVRVTSFLQVLEVECQVSKEMSLKIRWYQFKTINQNLPKENIRFIQQLPRHQRMFALLYQQITLISK